MQPIVTDRVAWSAHLSVTVVCPTKMAEPIEMLCRLNGDFGGLKEPRIK